MAVFCCSISWRHGDEMGDCEILRGSGDLTCATDCGLNVSPRYSYSDRTHRSGADSGFNWY